MKANERLQEIIDREGLNAKAFSEKLGFERPQRIYDILKNKTKTISEDLANKIISVFPPYSKVWIITGEGSMLKGGDIISHNQDNKASFNLLSNVNSNNTLGTALEKLITEISEQRKSYTDMIAKRDEQIDKLIDKLTEK